MQESDQSPVKPKRKYRRLTGQGIDQQTIEQERKERHRQYVRDWYNQKRQDPEWIEKEKEKNRPRTREYQRRRRQDPEYRAKENVRRREHTRKWYARVKQDPEFRAKERKRGGEYYRKHCREPERIERQRLKDRERYYRNRQNPEWVERQRVRVRKCLNELYRRSEEFRARHNQATKKRLEALKKRMENDPHFAYYHKEYLKAKERERKGLPEIDPNILGDLR